MVKTEGKRTRPGDLFLLAILLANLVCGVGLIGALRADLSKDLVAAESTLVSSKISAYLWGKILRFTSAVEQGRRVGENVPVKGDADALTVVGDLPAEWNFQRIRSGTGEWLPVFMGTPRDLPNRGHVLPLGFLVTGGSRQDQRYVIGAISLADVDGYLGDLQRRGILCRIVDPEGHTLFGATGGFPARRDSASRFEGEAPVMGGALSREWSLQTFIPDASSRLPFLPQAILATFFLLNMATLVFLRQRFILPSEAALAAVAETVAAQGEILPSAGRPRLYRRGRQQPSVALPPRGGRGEAVDPGEYRAPHSGDLRIPKESAVAPPAHQEDAPVAAGRRSLRDPPRRDRGGIRFPGDVDREGLRRRVPRVPGRNRSRHGESAPDPAVASRLPSGADVLVREPAPRIPPGTASSSGGGVDPRFLSRSLSPGDEKS